ncbi:TIGR04255 family protein [Mesorhizobium sp. M4A.F.Ca.ET.022.05.2.1]|uniref:TIGR04255 family protein n=1 Tax=Mesorhizobium sp. M4A.F.Ca.ET.022.05.2.1 TaxID=2496653 RepID=UPI000FCA4D09|nr:TIGR04255 family protein [Mesorhizobium sp. M4A.F.Ca.ET.022.05.2.1]RVC75352.1 TIGR04255 family protein [Mesorhizobium sp. M4A.F.Ca.ET.022.05.2.1]
MAKPRELLYEHAPLTEVIAEIHWALTPLQMAPGAAIDPFYSLLEDRLTSQLAQSGYVHIETRVPDEVPREMLAHAVVRLFRTSPSTWPVYQIGPGVFTANVVPPYGGWSKFRPFLRQGLDYLLGAYPDKAHLRPERIVLRYVNAFGPEHGLITPANFISEYVGLSVSWPDAVGEVSNQSNDVSLTGDLRLPIADLPGAIGLISWKEGTRPSGDKVVVLNLSVNAPLASTIDVELWSKTFDSAHAVISKLFEGIIADKIRPLLGKELKA